MAFHQLLQILHIGTKPGGFMKTERIVVSEKVRQPTGPRPGQSGDKKLIFHGCKQLYIEMTGKSNVANYSHMAQG